MGNIFDEMLEILNSLENMEKVFSGKGKPYEERMVDRYEWDDHFVSTAATEDGGRPYETGIYHDNYNEHVTVVEEYDTIEEAREGHKKWVKIMTTEPLPDKLIEASRTGIMRLMEIVDPERTEEFKVKKNQYPDVIEEVDIERHTANQEK